MKIICESMKEYDDLMRASKHLHDLAITKKDFKGLPRGTAFVTEQDRYPTLAFLCHLYLTEEDFADKFEVILIEDNTETKEN
jgi:hypothetical protein